MDTDPFNDMQHQHHYGDFARGFAAAFIGAVIGKMLDNTRFGRWFNTSRIVGIAFQLFLLYLIYLAGVYVYCLIKVW